MKTRLSRIIFTFAMAGAALLAALPAAAQPFTQCPAIQRSPGCAVLITINPSGSLTIQTDPSVGPYDGVEDTLVGVYNNSGGTVYGISLTGNSIFGFDGDGAGTGGAYQGPGVSFTAADSSNGIVNFDAGLASKSSLWFSLEGSPGTVKLKKKIAVDPGHGQTNCPAGKTGTTGKVLHLEEYRLSLAIGLALQTRLQNNNYEVLMTRTALAPCPAYAQRYGVANDGHVNAFVSIHLDGVDNNLAARGTGALYSSTRLNPTSSKSLASTTAAGTAAALGFPLRGIHAQDVAVVNGSRMAAALVEVAFLSNAADEAGMAAANAPDLAAIGIYAGIDAFFNQ